MTTLVKVEAIWTPESQQAIFRAALNTLSFPGRVQDIAGPLSGGRAELGVLATVVDEHVTLADPDDLLTTAERRLLAPSAIVDANEAEYVLLDGSRPPLPGLMPCIGTLYRPETAALLIITCDEVGDQVERPALTVTVTGPGVEADQSFSVAGLHPEWLAARNRWCGNFPTGCDLILCDEHRIVGIPRTSKVTFTGEGG